MLPEIGISELLVIGVIALIVVGPKDLPVLMRRVGGWLARARGMAADFRASFDEMARQSELDDLRREVEAMRRGDFSGTGQALSETQAEIDATMSEINSRLKSGEMNIYPPLTGGVTEDAPQQPSAELMTSEAIDAGPSKPKRVRKSIASKASSAEMDSASPPAVQSRRQTRKATKA